MKWLKERLTKSAIRANDARGQGELQGISYGTLRRAYREIGGVTVHKGRPPLDGWYWTLPGATAQNPGGELCADEDFDPLEDFFRPFMQRASGEPPPAPQNP
jgi:hypothetical protein